MFEVVSSGYTNGEVASNISEYMILNLPLSKRGGFQGWANKRPNY